MEFAHLNATLRSAHFPPYDPWYAGGYINYYYYGLYLVAFCLKLTGIPAEIGFNLAQPTMIALLASAGYAVAATLGRDLTGRSGGGRPVGAALGGAAAGRDRQPRPPSTRLLGRELPPLRRVRRLDLGPAAARSTTRSPSSPSSPGSTPISTPTSSPCRSPSLAIALGYALARDRRDLAWRSVDRPAIVGAADGRGAPARPAGARPRQPDRHQRLGRAGLRRAGRRIAPDGDFRRRGLPARILLTALSLDCWRSARISSSCRSTAIMSPSSARWRGCASRPRSTSSPATWVDCWRSSSGSGRPPPAPPGAADRPAAAAAHPSAGDPHHPRRRARRRRARSPLRSQRPGRHRRHRWQRPGAGSWQALSAPPGSEPPAGEPVAAPRRPGWSASGSPSSRWRPGVWSWQPSSPSRSPAESAGSPGARPPLGSSP